MKLKLIESENKKEIGTIDFEFIPRKEEIIEFENNTYVCRQVFHSEKGVIILVSKKTTDYQLHW